MMAKKYILFIGIVAVLQSCNTKETIAPKSPPVPTLSACGLNVITGYTDKTSYYPGDSVTVFLQSSSSLQCGLNFYDVNGTLAFTANVSIYPQLTQPVEPWKNGFNFAGNGKVKLPSTLVSGIYFIENKIRFIVKSATTTDLTVVYPTNTINAYNLSGGKDMYTHNSAAPIVSFLRPTDGSVEESGCDACLKWFPSLSNIKVNYISDIDLDDYSTFQFSRVIAIIGHNEYWSRKARNNFDRFIDEGKNAIILSGNTMWWQVRYTAAKDAMICYKNAGMDPEPDPLLKTINWYDPSLQYPILSSIGADFNHGGYGLKVDNGWDGYKIYNPSAPLLEGLNLKKGEIISLPTSEYDGAPTSGFDSGGFPILDNSQLKFQQFELIGFDLGSRGGKETIGTFVILQKTRSSGIIVNTGSNKWCSSFGIGSSNSGQKIKTITQNAIVKLLAGSKIFSN